MYGVEVSTVIYRPSAEVYDFLMEFPRYVDDSEYLEEIRPCGDDSDDPDDPGARYDITFSWRALTYTVRSRVTDAIRPNEIGWRLVSDGDARGYWSVAPEPASAPDLDTPATRVRFYVEFAPESADLSDSDLPSSVSFEALVDRIKEAVETEARSVVERIVAELEGESRAVDLEVHRLDQSSNSP